MPTLSQFKYISTRPNPSTSPPTNPFLKKTTTTKERPEEGKKRKKESRGQQEEGRKPTKSLNIKYFSLTGNFLLFISEITVSYYHNNIIGKANYYVLRNFMRAHNLWPIVTKVRNFSNPHRVDVMRKQSWNFDQLSLQLLDSIVWFAVDFQSSYIADPVWWERLMLALLTWTCIHVIQIPR